jgi:hypothetical protein
MEVVDLLAQRSLADAAEQRFEGAQVRDGVGGRHAGILHAA